MPASSSEQVRDVLTALGLRNEHTDEQCEYFGRTFMWGITKPEEMLGLKETYITAVLLEAPKTVFPVQEKMGIEMQLCRTLNVFQQNNAVEQQAAPKKVKREEPEIHANTKTTFIGRPTTKRPDSDVPQIKGSWKRCCIVGGADQGDRGNYFSSRDEALDFVKQVILNSIFSAKLNWSR